MQVFKWPHGPIKSNVPINLNQMQLTYMYLDVDINHNSVLKRLQVWNYFCFISLISRTSSSCRMLHLTAWIAAVESLGKEAFMASAAVCNRSTFLDAITTLQPIRKQE